MVRRKTISFDGFGQHVYILVATQLTSSDCKGVRANKTPVQSDACAKLRNCNLSSESSRDLNWLATRIELILARLLANFYCQHAGRHMNIYNLRDASTRESGQFVHLVS